MSQKRALVVAESGNEAEESKRRKREEDGSTNYVFTFVSGRLSNGVSYKTSLKQYLILFLTHRSHHVTF